MKDADKVLELLSECAAYLHSWACVREGEYCTKDIKAVTDIFMNLIALKPEDPIRAFKDGVENGSILLTTFQYNIPEDVKKRLYKRHCEIVKEFEKKYKINNGTC